MSKASCLIRSAGKVFKQMRKLSYHFVIVRRIVTGYAEDLIKSKFVFQSFININSYLITDPEVIQDFSECRCKIKAGMGAGDFNDIQQHRHWNALIFKVNSNGNICLVVG